MFLIGTFDPQSDMENGFLGRKGMGEGVHGGYPGLPVGTACEAVGYLRSSPFRLEGRDEGGEITKNKTPESKESEWTWKLTNLFCVCFQGISGGGEGGVWLGGLCQA